MKYCVQCGSEYVDTVTECADCGASEFGSAEELKKRGIPNPQERDTRKFVSAGQTEDPFTVERIEEALQEAGIPLFARPRRAGSIDNITTPLPQPWWELLVPEEHLGRAAVIVARELADIESEAPAAEAAAEQEALAGPKL